MQVKKEIMKMQQPVLKIIWQVLIRITVIVRLIKRIQISKLISTVPLYLIAEQSFKAQTPPLATPIITISNRAPVPAQAPAPHTNNNTKASWIVI